MHPEVTADAHPDRTAVVMDDGETRSYAQLTADELAFIVADSGARVYVTSAAYGERAAAIVPHTPGVEHRFSVGGPVPGHAALEPAATACADAPLPGAVAGADMLYSSGTTGRPKGISPRGAQPALHTPISFAKVMRDVVAFGAGDVYLSPAPAYHAAPLRGCLATHQLGGTVVMMRRWDAAAALALIDRHRVTHAQLVPTMFGRLLRLDPTIRAAHALSSLRCVITGAAPCPPEVKRAMIDWLGPIVHEYYGSTEGCGLTWVTSEEWLARPGTVGRAVKGVPHVLAEDGTELPAGETGTIFFSGGPPFEYHNDPAKTAGAHNDAGWATVGDIGRVDDDGFLYLTDRAAHLIISGGVNIYPQEAENVLATHPAVIDAAVFGIPDAEFGEQVKAVVQPAELPADESAAGALEAALIAHCRERLADLKCPRSIDFRAALPRHETGKLYKRLLVDEYRAAAQPD